MSIDLDLATTEQIADELSTRPNEDFVFIFRRKGTDLWAIRFNQSINCLSIVELLAAQQANIVKYLIKEHEAEQAAEAQDESEEWEDNSGEFDAN